MTSDGSLTQVTIDDPATRSLSRRQQRQPASMTREEALEHLKLRRHVLVKSPLAYSPGSFLRGNTPKVPAVIANSLTYVVLDSGAEVSVIMEDKLRQLDPDFRPKLSPGPATIQGFGGHSSVIGVYPCTMVWPHPDSCLHFSVSFLVLGGRGLASHAYLGREWQHAYRISIVYDPAPEGAYIKVGSLPNRWALNPCAGHVGAAKLLALSDSTAATKGSSLSSASSPLASQDTLSDLPSTPNTPLTHSAASPPHSTPLVFTPSIADRYPSTDPTITWSDFEHVIRKPMAKTAPTFLATLQNGANINPELTDEQKGLMRKVIAACEDAFVPEDGDYKTGKLGEELHLDAKIPHPPPRALRKAPYATSNNSREVIRQQVETLLQRGLIRPSRSPYAAPTIVIYRGEKARMCHDYRVINEFIDAPAYPLPNLFASLQAVGKAKYFTSLDLKDAFYCMKLDEASIPLTAFVTPDGLYEWLVACFGITSYPPEFQKRISDHFRQEIRDLWFRIYIDDGLISSMTFEEHLWHTFAILRSLMKPGCRVSFRKAFFGYFELKYLGHKLNGLTIALDEGRLAVLERWPVPASRLDVQKFLGFTGYHRVFVPAYARVVAPLQALVPQDSTFRWTPDEQSAFDAVIEALKDAVRLTRPDFLKPFIVYTDACLLGLAAGLYQEHDGVERPLAFISRGLRKGEHAYGATQLECLAVVWMLEKFHYYLDGANVTIVTDCIALRSLLTAKWAHRQLIRWQAAIQGFRGRLTIVHRAGKLHANADVPSRQPLPNDVTNPAADLDPDDTIEIGGITYIGCAAALADFAAPSDPGKPPTRRVLPLEPVTMDTAPFIVGEKRSEIAVAMTALCSVPHAVAQDSGPLGEHPQISTPASELVASALGAIIAQDLLRDIPLPEGAIKGRACSDILVGAITSVGLSTDFMAQVAKGYEADPTFSTILAALKRPNDVDTIERLGAVHSKAKEELLAGRLTLLEGLIYRRVQLATALVIADEATQTLVLDLCHDHSLAGHFSFDRTYERVRALAWWPGLYSKTHDYCATCQPCQRAKRHTGKSNGLLQRIEQPTRPWEAISLDFVTGLPESGEERYNAVLVLICRMTRLAFFLPCRNDETAKTTALLYLRHVLPVVGLAESMLSDRDPKFVADFYQTLYTLIGTRLKFSTAHHAQTDGLTERPIGTLEEGLRTFCGYGADEVIAAVQVGWHLILPMFSFAYNSSRHGTTKQIPYLAAFGWIPRGPESLVRQQMAFKKLEDGNTDAQHLAHIIEQARLRSQAAITDAFEAHKRRYDATHREVAFPVGSRAYLSTRFFKFENIANKLKPAQIGPFVVLENIGKNAVKLDISRRYKLRHPVFPVSLLTPEKTSTASFPDRRIPREPAGEIVDGQEEWEVEAIVAHRDVRQRGIRRREYEVRWVGHSDTTWEPEDCLTHSSALLTSYLATLPAHERLVKPIQSSLAQPLPADGIASRLRHRGLAEDSSRVLEGASVSGRLDQHDTMTTRRSHERKAIGQRLEQPRKSRE